MTSLNTDEKVLPVDERGRVWVSKERRKALLEEFDRSRMSGAKFARLVGVKYPTFMYWVKQRREGGGNDALARANPTPAINFVEALIEGSAGNGARPGLSIDLPGGARLQVESLIQLQLAAELLRMLGTGGR